MKTSGRMNVLALSVLAVLGLGPASRVHADPPSVIRVEIDWLVGEDHTHFPSTNCIIEQLELAFEWHGIELILEFSDAIPETEENMQINFSIKDFFEGGEWAELEATYRDHPPGTGWHYAILGHNYSIEGFPTSSSGVAEILGDEFLVSLGSFDGGIGTPFDQAGTFMHELGHNLGLKHAGDQDASEIKQYKPNYASVMAYRYQLRGVRQGMLCDGLTADGVGLRDLDFSDGTLPTIDETALSEASGIGLGAVDWNCSGTIGGTVAKDVSSGFDWCGSTGTQSVLTDYDDWANIVDVTGGTFPGIPEIAQCITAEERRSFAGPCDQPDLCKLVEVCQGIDVPDAGVLSINGTAGVENVVNIPAGGSITASMAKPVAGGNGKFVVHMNAGSPEDGDQITELPAKLGLSCFDFLIPSAGTGLPVSVWNNIGKTHKIGETNYFGTPGLNPAKAPTVFWSGSDVVNLPSGSRWTLQGVIINPTATSPKGASVTNAIEIQID